MARKPRPLLLPSNALPSSFLFKVLHGASALSFIPSFHSCLNARPRGEVVDVALGAADGRHAVEARAHVIEPQLAAGPGDAAQVIVQSFHARGWGTAVGLSTNAIDLDPGRLSGSKHSLAFEQCE